MGLNQAEYGEELLVSFALLIRLSRSLYHSCSSSYEFFLRKLLSAQRSAPNQDSFGSFANMAHVLHRGS